MNTIIVSCQNCSTKNRIPAAKQHLNPKCGKCKATINMDSAAQPVQLDDDTFTNFINQATLPVMVDFFSPTCGPCRMLTPTIDKLTNKYLGRVIIAKIDTSKNQMTAVKFQIRGVPTLLFFNNGQVTDQITGAAPEQTLVQMLNKLL